LKGDGNIKIKIKFIGVGYNDLYQANVKIYDSSNNIVYDGKTYNGILTLYLKKSKVYIVKATFKSQVICSPIYVLDDTTYIFSFIKNTIPTNRTVTFLLTDYYYNLPIEKGEILLWQR